MRQGNRFALILFAALLLRAASPGPLQASGDPKPPAVSAEPIPAGAVRVDGRLDEPVWEGAPAAGPLFQKDPNEGAPSSRRTEVFFLYDREALYVGARLFTEDPAGIRAAVTRRDNSGNAERLIVTLDTYRDRRTAYSFAVTAEGVRIDYVHPEDEEHSRDYSFDPVWEARTARTEDGWTAEMRIPFSQLRFREGEEQVWGLNINRWMPDRNEDAYWVMIPKNESGYASRFGALTGISGIRPSRRIELTPYAAAEGIFAGGANDADPFRKEREFDGRAGVDFKMGLASNVTLEGTVNPDFGQVEADPAEVNLSAYETFFDEKRPFFIEGAGLLTGNGPDYFYSRRIGEAPRLDPGGDRAAAPANATILGAAKLTGRMDRGLSIGALGALTAREYAEVFVDSTGVRSRVKTAPLAGYGVFRLRQEFGDGGSQAGLILTGVGRKMGEGEDVASVYAREAIAGGADWEWRFHDRVYALTGFAGFSRVRGEPEAILEIQRSSAHYFQRPDANHVDLDSSRASLMGHAFSLELAKTAGRHWLWEGSVALESPGFELNDLGELQSADDIDARASLRYRENEPGPLFRSYSIALYNLCSWNYGGDAVGGGHEINFNATWRNHWSSWAGYYIGPRRKSDSLTRGGPLMETLRLHNAWVGFSTNFASNVRGEIGAAFYRWEEDGWTREAETTLSVRTGGRWEFSLEPYYGRTEHPRQYVAAVAGGGEETYGKRYVFSRIARSTARIRFRLNYAFHPELTLEAYAEPFAASGRYDRFGELATAGSRDLTVYGEEGGTTIVRNDDGSRTVTDGEDEFVLSDRDFRILSFRSNVVLRWEWRPGSVLYLVWQRNQGTIGDPAGFVGARDLWDSVAGGGDHFLGLKISYWIPLS